MSQLRQVSVKRLEPQRFESILPPDRYERFAAAIVQAQKLFEGRIVWNVNSTAKGGGVAEMLRSLLAYARGADVDARWLVIEGNPDFFKITKRIHNHLHGSPGDGGELGDKERRAYEWTLATNAEELEELVEPNDFILLHDPQAAGLIPALKRRGCSCVIWRCHVGLDLPNELARGAWRFLVPYVSAADAYIFSRRAFTWEGLDGGKTRIIPPSIDAFSAKNQDMDRATVQAILRATEIIDEMGPPRAAGRPASPAGTSHSDDAVPAFLREDGSPGRVTRSTQMYDGGPPPPPGAPLVVQVSRWDRLKDPLGVMMGFVDHVAPNTDAHLILAGPSVEAVADDPEGAEVLNEVRDKWAALERDVAARVHLACLPMEDGEENAAIVNALQRRADVVVQKSIAEGFGLTVAEAMWKARPVVASKIGGIQDQISDGATGVLVDDPHDLAAFGAAVTGLLEDAEGAARMGREAQARVRDEFLGPRHLMQYVELMGALLG
ncbi:MAG: glycosyltransferase [Actinomycetota bacterium]